MKSKNYFFLSIIFIGFFFIVQFTEIYGNSTWFKAFLLIIGGAFLLGGLSQKRKEKNEH